VDTVLWGGIPVLGDSYRCKWRINEQMDGLVGFGDVLSTPSMWPSAVREEKRR
jgi:hypothetical protein